MSLRVFSLAMVLSLAANPASQGAPFVSDWWVTESAENSPFLRLYREQDQATGRYGRTGPIYGVDATSIVGFATSPRVLVALEDALCRANVRHFEDSDAWERMVDVLASNKSALHSYFESDAKYYVRELHASTTASSKHTRRFTKELMRGHERNYSLLATAFIEDVVRQVRAALLLSNIRVSDQGQAPGIADTQRAIIRFVLERSKRNDCGGEPQIP